MKKLYIIYIALLFIFGCKSNEKKFDDVELMAYIISYYSTCDHYLLEHPRIICCYYTLTDNSGKTKLVVQNMDVKNDIKYYDIAIDKKIIDNLADSLLKLKSYNLLIKSGDYFYDEPNLKIRLNKYNETKTVCFQYLHNNKSHIYLSFYNYIDSLIENNKLTVTKDTSNLLKRRSDFINCSFKMDTLIYPPPPLPLNPIKYAPPIIAKEHHKHPKKD